MLTLYVSEQGCYVCLEGESVLIKRGERVLGEAQLPLLEQILIFGQSQVTTQLIRVCLKRDIPIAYLSRMGYCYGRIMPIERGYRALGRYQQALTEMDRLLVACCIVQAKLKNSRVILRRQQRRQDSPAISLAINGIDHLIERAGQGENIAQLMGCEGAGANLYFMAFSDCLNHGDFVFMGRSRRPPGNPVNAMLSFGYQVLWNHIFSLIEIQGLDPYSGCLHQGSERHAALASDLIEEFRSPIVDSLVLYLVNRRLIDPEADFVFVNGGCFLNESGRKKYLRGFLQRMEEDITTEEGSQPKWHILTRQVKNFKKFVYQPINGYQPYLIR
ncbi:MAG: CRISPR-associated endonuclease Cas1 [Microcoleaceae cyanobacterium]